MRILSGPTMSTEHPRTLYGSFNRKAGSEHLVNDVACRSDLGCVIGL